MSYEGSGELSIIKSDYQGILSLKRCFYRKIFFDTGNYYISLMWIQVALNIKKHHIALYPFLKYNDKIYYYLTFT